MITLDGLPLHNPGVWRLGSDSRLKAFPGRMSADAQLPGRDGALPSFGSSFEVGAIRLSFNLSGRTRTEVESNCELLFGVLGQRHRLLDLVDEDRERAAQIEVLSSSEPDRLGAFLWRLTAAASLPAVYWRSLAAVDAGTLLAAAPSIVNLDPLAGTTGSINDALIRFKGGFSTATVTDPVSGDSLTINTALAATEYLVIDAANWVARKHTTDSWSLTGGTNAITSVVSNRGAGPIYTLNPDFVTGAGRVQLLASAVNPSGSPSVTVRAKRSFL